MEQSTLFVPAVHALRRTAMAAPVTFTITCGAIFASSAVYLRVPMVVYDRSRMIQVAFLALGALAFVARRSGGQIRLGVSWERHLLGALTISALASVALAEVLDIAIREAALFGLLAVLTLAVAHEAQQDGAETVRRGIVAFAVVVGFTTMVAALLPPEGVRHAADPVWANPRILGHTTTWVVPLVVAAAVQATGRSRGAYWVLAVVWMTLSSFSGSRGSWVGIAVGLMLALALDRRNRRAWLVISSSALLLGGPLGVLLNVPVGSVRTLESMIASGTSGRWDIWVRTVDLWQQRPLFGIGPGGLSVIGQPPTSPHNAPLQLLAEWGAVVTGLTFLLIAVAIVKSIQAWDLGADVEQVAWRIGLVATATAAGTDSLVSGIIVAPVSQVLLVLVLGGLIGVSPLSRSADSRKRPAVRAVAVLLLACLLVVTAVTTKPDREERDTIYPRFWVVGPDGFRDLGE